MNKRIVITTMVLLGDFASYIAIKAESWSQRITWSCNWQMLYLPQLKQKVRILLT